MKITIDEQARASLTYDEYKYLLLLEFHSLFWEKVSEIRQKIGGIATVSNEEIIGYKEMPNLKLLQEETASIMEILNMPLLLFGAIESIIQWNRVFYTVKPILILGIQAQLNRRALYNEQLLPLQTTRNNNTEMGRMIKNGWYESNKRVLEKSIAPACPVIQIQKKLTKRQLKKAIDEEWQSIKESMDDYEKSVSFPIETIKVSIRDIENNGHIYRYREQGLQHPEIYKKLYSEHKITYAGGEAEMRRKYSKFCKVLKNIGFLTENA